MASDGNYRFAINDDVLCYYGVLLYKAKCLNRRISNSGLAEYFVHFVGWKNTYDEWVKDIALLYINDVNLRKMNVLREFYLNSDKNKSHAVVSKVKEAQRKKISKRKYNTKSLASYPKTIKSITMPKVDMNKNNSYAIQKPMKITRPDLKETIDLTNEESNEDIIDLTDDLLESSSEDINSKSNDKHPALKPDTENQKSLFVGKRSLPMSNVTETKSLKLQFNKVLSWNVSIARSVPLLNTRHQSLVYPKTTNSNIWMNVKKPASLAYTRQPPLPLAQMLKPIPLALYIMHPAPLPVPINQISCFSWKGIPPAPFIKYIEISNQQIFKEIKITWNMSISNAVAHIKGYQIYVYHEDSFKKPKTDLWMNLGEITALPVPITCTIGKFMVKNTYHLAVRAVDIHSRVGPFSIVRTIHL